jgi:hypothetical protein
MFGRGNFAPRFLRAYYFEGRKGAAGPLRNFRLCVKEDGKVVIEGWSVVASQLQHSF